MENAKQLLDELKARGVSLYLRNSWITTKDTLTETELIRLSKCSSEMRALLKSEAKPEFGTGIVIGPVSEHESEMWGTTKNQG